jgi:uncharacterized protein involved in oxidation of intracellular sulfur
MILIVINDAPYGTEKAYNALRIAMTLQKVIRSRTVPAFTGFPDGRGV